MRTRRQRPTRAALLIIDVINPFDFPNGTALLRQSLPIAPRIAALARRWRDARWPVIYANDNRGKWRSNFTQVVAACSAPAARGAEFVAQLKPEPTDYFVLKPEQSAFFSTPLDDLLHDLRTRRLVLCGIAGDGCVLATALDASMRDYDVQVPADCVASASRARNTRALALLRDAWRVKIGASRGLRLN